MTRGKKKPNALKHGAYSGPTQLFIWGEAPADYDALRNGLYAEWTPNGLTEVHWVETLADLLWRRRRVDRYDWVLTLRRLREVAGQERFSRSVEKIRSFALDFYKARTVAEVDLIISKVSSTIDFDFSILVHSSWPLASDAAPETWGPQIAKGILCSELPERYDNDGELFAQGLDVIFMDEQLARIEHLDAMIDKTVKRLMQTKTMKQMLQALEPKRASSSVARLGSKQNADRERSLQ
jgi:hypothetical protein